MRIKDRLEYRSKPKPMTFKADALVSEAIEAMTKKNYGCVVITNDNNVVEGIVTERDFMTRLLYNNLDPKTTALRDIMTTDVRLAGEDDNMVEWLRQMSNERFRHLPVVDKNKKLVALMSQGDFVSYTWPELLDRVKEKAKATILPIYQVVFILTAILIYTLAMFFILPTYS